MQDILINVTSFSWWFGVVIVGILVNLASSFLKPSIDKWMEKFSDERRRKNFDEEKMWQDEIKKIRSNSHFRDIQLARLSYFQHEYVYFTITGITLFAMPIFLTSRESKLTGIIFFEGNEKLFLILFALTYLFGVVWILIGHVSANQARKLHLKILASDKNS